MDSRRQQSQTVGRSMMRARFSLRILLVAICLAAWLVAVSLPGGMYVHLPLGIGILLLMAAARAAWVLYFTSQESKRRRFWWQLAASTCALTVLLVVYPPFWSLAANHFDHAQSVANQRRYVLHEMDAVSAREAARQLLVQTTDTSQGHSLFPTDDIVPQEIKAMRPQYVKPRSDHLLVALGKQTESFYVIVYADGAEGRGTIRLAPGIWYFQPGSRRWITETEWDAGIRQ